MMLTIFAEIYLFFDYALHHHLPLDEINRRLREMLVMFDDDGTKILILSDIASGNLYFQYCSNIYFILFLKNAPEKRCFPRLGMSRIFF